MSLLLVAIVAILGQSCNKTTDNENINIPYEKYTMPNGLQVILHSDHSDPMISYAIMYHTGSSREVPGKTGFAHLFEHLLFGGSENVEPGRFDKIIEGVGGTNNGGTGRDYTVYYEVFPKNALEKILWLESDRMGFFINSVTDRLMAIQQNVVQNEKRQYEDNSPYGFTEWVINKNLFPQGHPYNWTVIGEMEDLKNATLNDVKEYYNTYYGPNNATLVLAGDFDPEAVKPLIEKYFGEISRHGEVAPRGPMNVKLEKTVRLVHEDNFANVPELTMVWPVTEAYNKDSYALDFLARILADGKKAPFYKVLVKEKDLTGRVSASNSSEELAGEFIITVRANEGRNLKEIEAAINEAFARFESEGITDRDIERIKAQSEMSFYQGITSILGKSFQLASYNTTLGNPGYIQQDLANIKAVTKEDVMNAYGKYIKGKPFVITSFVPKGSADMAAENSVPAGVKEENIDEASQVEIAAEVNEVITKTPSSIDRTAEPPAGPEPQVNLPAVWKAELSNGIKIAGIENKEMPLVYMTIVFEGGATQDDISLPGVSGLVAGLLPQGTKNKTPEELEEETRLLGSAISVSPGREYLTMTGSTLSRNFDATVSLMKEIILEPRWDSSEFSLAINRTKNSILQEEALPRSIAGNSMYRLIYGDGNILGYNIRGTRESVNKITLDDLKAYYNSNFSPTLTKILVAGDVTKEQVLAAFGSLENEWKPVEVVKKNYPAPQAPEKSVIYFIDVPGSRQSVIYIGYPAITRSNPDYVKADFVNYRLGGAFTSIFNQILREQKGYTYGASSYFGEMKTTAPFLATSMVRSDATFESVRIFREEMENYRNGISEEDLQFTKNYLLRSNALRFETNSALTGMLLTMIEYGLPDDYIKQEEEIIRNMTIEEHKAITGKYIIPDKMYYLVVGDASSQMKALEKIGFGKPVLLTR